LLNPAVTPDGSDRRHQNSLRTPPIFWQRVPALRLSVIGKVLITESNSSGNSPGGLCSDSVCVASPSSRRGSFLRWGILATSSIFGPLQLVRVDHPACSEAPMRLRFLRELGLATAPGAKCRIGHFSLALLQEPGLFSCRSERDKSSQKESNSRREPWTFLFCAFYCLRAARVGLQSACSRFQRRAQNSAGLILSRPAPPGAA